MQTAQQAWCLDATGLIQDCTNKKAISIPLQFQFLPVQILSKQFTKLNNPHPYRIHYLGPRFQHTLALHKKYSHNDKHPLQPISLITEQQPFNKYQVDYRKIIQSYIVQQTLRMNTFYKSKLFYRAFEGMNPSLNLQNQFSFNSIFQSGNLDCVIKVGEVEFDLFLRIDSNTKGHIQWFYFSVKNKRRLGKIKLNICNLNKAKSLYQHGMQPYIYSRQKAKETNNGWMQSGANLGIEKKELRYQVLYNKCHQTSYYCLVFQYDFEYDDDEVFFAYCVPYTLSKLLQDISTFPSYTKYHILGKSLAGIDIPLLHITNHLNKHKKNIIITARTHPGEPNASHMLNKFMQFLNGNDKQAIQLRNRVNFFIIPMLNVDGVVIGNTRASAAGKDLNRQFMNANKDMYPQVFLVKEFARKLHHMHGVFMYLDFHGHSSKKNTFVYGPAYGITEPNYFKCRLLPKIIEKINSNFRFHSCSFNIYEEKKQTARVMMFQHLKIGYTYTIQTSIGYYYDSQKMRNEQFNVKEWGAMGHSIAEGLSKFIVGYQEYEELIKVRRASRCRNRVAQKQIIQYKPEEEQLISIIKRSQPLHITYQEKSLFAEMINQMKNYIKAPSSYIKEIDQDCESDEHDERQDLHHSKMTQFNYLLAQVGKKQPFASISKGKRLKQINTQILNIRKEVAVNIDDIQDEEKQFMRELQQVKKSLTRQYKSFTSTQNKTKQLKINTKQLSNFTKQTSFSKTTTILYQYSNKIDFGQKLNIMDKKTMNRSFSRKMGCVSESQLGEKNIQKISYFGQFHLFVDREEQVYHKASPAHRNNVFKKLRLKEKKMQASRLLSQKDFKQPSVYTQQKIKAPSSLHKANAFQFKFDDIQTCLAAKQKLNYYMRTNINRTNMVNAIGQASFYGIRPNTRQKINHKRKMIQQQESKEKSKEKSKTKRQSFHIINLA